VRGILESHKVILKEALTVEIEKREKIVGRNGIQRGFYK